MFKNLFKEIGVLEIVIGLILIFTTYYYFTHNYKMEPVEVSKIKDIEVKHINDVDIEKLDKNAFNEDIASLENILKENSIGYILDKKTYDDSFNKIKRDLEINSISTTDFYNKTQELSNEIINNKIIDPETIIERSKYEKLKLLLPFREMGHSKVVAKNSKLIDLLKSSGVKSNQNDGSSSNTTSDKNKGIIETKIIEKDKIAYIKIPTFIGWSGIEENALSTFLRDIKQYPYLIIDVRGNKDGNVKAGPFILSQIIDKPIEETRYYGFRDGKLSKELVDYILTVPEEFKNISGEKRELLKEIPKSFTNKDDKLLKNLKYIIKASGTINNKSQYPFKGKIYLLVDENTSKTADLLAQTAKKNNVMELVGNKTKGNGTSRMDGYYFYSLPNSGIVFSIDCAHSLNEDGSSNLLNGTEPNINTSDKDSFEYVLKELIK